MVKMQSRFRRKSKGRRIDGVLVLNKSPGVTSNGALQEVKRLYRAAKAGHTGSLDPLATGVLPLCFGEATRFSQFLLEADKHYRARIRLGVATTTGDSEGEVIAEKPVPELKSGQIEDVLKNFRGEIEQIPSMYSALKVGGEPLYKLARQGIEVEREKRKVKIYNLELLEQKENELYVDVRCSKGTYIRSLAEDIGTLLNTGGHVTELERLSSGPFSLEDSVTVDELKDTFARDGMEALDQYLKPCCTAVDGLPFVEMTPLTASYLRQGQAVQLPGAPTEGWVRLYVDEEQEEKQFIGVGEVMDDGRIAPRRLLSSS